jgi:hypothetical protein
MNPTPVRSRLSQHDLDFLIHVLAPSGQETAALQNLLADEEVRDDLLDHPRLLDYLIRRHYPVSISLPLYFYVMVRHALREYKIDDRAIADYVAGLLVEFSSTERANRIESRCEKSYDYFVDMLYDLIETGGREAFLLNRHIGDHALFISGVFPDFVYHRERYRPPSPGFKYYEQMGSDGYQRASRHTLAERYQLAGVFELLAQQFRHIRLALNFMTDEYLHLDRNKMSMDRVLRRLEYFTESRGRNVL